MKGMLQVNVSARGTALLVGPGNETESEGITELDSHQVRDLSSVDSVMLGGLVTDLNPFPRGST